MSGSLLDSEKGRLVEFDYLRGLAIALIVLGHSIFLSEQGFPLLLENVLRGGTGLFVFISGFFFHRVFYQGFEYRHFMGKKLRLVLVPFLAISLIGLGFRIIGWAQDGHGIDTLLLNSWYTLRNGYVLYPHWYIPFIFLTFLCSPLHIRYIRAQPSLQVLALIVFSLVALFMHRPQSNGNFLQSLVYFTPYYLLGILFSQYQHQLRHWHRELLAVSFALVAITALAQTYWWPHIGNYHKAPFTYAGIDLQFIQTLFACIALLGLCSHIQWRWLQLHLCWLARLSFPIFFIHPLLTIALENLVVIEILKPFFPVSGLEASLLVFSAVFLVQFYGAAAIAVNLKAALPSASRRLIG